jgi:prefoldin subunit 5
MTEIEIAPGIYLTKRSTNKVRIQNQIFLGQATPLENMEYMQQQVEMLNRSIAKLDETNLELEGLDDPEFVLAVQENILVKQKQLEQIRQFNLKIDQLQQKSCRGRTQLQDTHDQVENVSPQVEPEGHGIFL